MPTDSAASQVDGIAVSHEDFVGRRCGIRRSLFQDRPIHAAFQDRPIHAAATNESLRPGASVAKELDVASFMFCARKGEKLVKKPGEIGGQQFILEDLDDCEVLLLDHCAQVCNHACVDVAWPGYELLV